MNTKLGRGRFVVMALHPGSETLYPLPENEYSTRKEADERAEYHRREPYPAGPKYLVLEVGVDVERVITYRRKGGQ